MFERTRLALVMIVLAWLTGLGGGCKKDAPTEPEEPARTVSVTLYFYNHTRGFITQKTVTGQSGARQWIRISDAEAGDVDARRIAVRKIGAGNGLGELVGFSTNGKVLTTFPDHDLGYDVFLMNSASGANYQLIDEWTNKGPGAGVLSYPPNAAWQREDRDGQTGPVEPLNEAVAQLNAALSYPWKKYGSLTQVNTGRNFGIGYGNCDGNAGWHSAVWAGVNPKVCKDYPDKLRIFLAEIFELQTQTADLGGRNTNETICDSTGNLNPIGKDLWAYSHVKDSKTSASTNSRTKFSFGLF